LVEHLTAEKENLTAFFVEGDARLPDDHAGAGLRVGRSPY